MTALRAFDADDKNVNTILFQIQFLRKDTAIVAEPTRRETQLGLADLTQRLKTAGVPIAAQNTDQFLRRHYFAIGTPNRQTDFEVSTSFLDDLPNTEEYRNGVEAYAHSVSARIQFGSPEVFHTRAGVPVRIEVQWPIEPSQDLVGCMLTTVTTLLNGQVEKCAVSMIATGGRYMKTVFDDLRHNTNRVRYAIDDGDIEFYSPDAEQERWKPILRLSQARTPATQIEVRQFLASKAYVMGFLAPDTPTSVWLLDPWDAEYLQVGIRDLGLAARLLKANGLLDLDDRAAYGTATDKLLQQSALPPTEEGIGSTQRRDLSLSNIPRAEVFNTELSALLKESAQFAVLMIDLDQFKQLNDTFGHLEGNKCLDGTINAIARVVGRKGKVFRWGGDEFAVILPDFTTEEASVTAERIRAEIEGVKLGGSAIAVTSSIGVCSIDRIEDKTVEGVTKCADIAMYESKAPGGDKLKGHNRVSTWPVTARHSTAAADGKNG